MGKKVRWAAILVALFIFSLTFTATERVANAQSEDPRLPLVQPPTIGSCEEQLIWPYEGEFKETQGIHGGDYGHAAVDISQGRGAVIYAPTCGEARFYRDGLSNTVLEIHNENFIVTLLHGEFEIEDGEWVELGQPVGVESNIGNTEDGNGDQCWPLRGCGYHTHLNVFAKAEWRSVDPRLAIDGELTLLAPWWRKLRYPLPSTLNMTERTFWTILALVVGFFLVRKVWRRLSKLGPVRRGVVVGTLMASLPFVLVFNSMLIEGGVPLERVATNFFPRDGLVRELLSEVSEVDPYRIAWGINPSMQLREWDQSLLQQSALPTFPINYWNGQEVTFWAEPEVWETSKQAAGIHGCDPLLVTAIAHSESPTYQNEVCSEAGACGTWQFMPDTWNSYWPAPEVRPNRFQREYAADAACRMVNDLRLAQQPNASRFVIEFTGADGGPPWNRHNDQALYVWRLWQQLQKEVVIEQNSE